MNKLAPLSRFRSNAAQHPLKGILGALVLAWGVVAVQPPVGAQPVGPSIVVNSTGDSADPVGDRNCDTGNLNANGDPECTLRAAIETGNDHIDINSIEFNIPATDPGLASGAWVITTATPLPNIFTGVMIDATTQPTWNGTGLYPAPVVVLDGSPLTDDTQPGLFFVAGGDFSQVSGLSIVGHPGHAIQSNADNLTVNVNYVGLRPDQSPQGNGLNGVFIRGRGAFVAGNVISANVNDGVTLDSDVSGTTIVGNLIGLAPDGTPHGNINGIWTQGTGLIQIGGDSPGLGNTIANSTYNGIQVSDGQEVSMLGNSIYNNGASGIILDPGGTLSVNDPGDLDVGPNGLINYPELSDSGIDNQVNFEFDGYGSDYRIEFFTNPSGPHANGRGEGEVYVGSVDIVHPGGAANYSFSDPGLAAGAWVSATTTLTNPGLFIKTSEFAPSFQMPGPRTLVVNSTADAVLDPANGGICTTGNLNSEGNAECTLRAAITLAEEMTTRDEISFDIPIIDPGYSAGVWTLGLPVDLPQIFEPLVIDGSTQPGFVSTPVIELDGQGGTGAGLLIDGDNMLIRSLAVGGFGDGIRILAGTGNQVLGNHIGLDASGTLARPNADDGIHVGENVYALEIGGIGAGDGNLIANNDDDGISTCCANVTGLLIRGNVIGTDITQTLNMANLDNGIAILRDVQATIGGSTAGSGNVIVNHPNNGIAITGPDSDIDIQGNRIGLSSTGTPMPNDDGIYVENLVTDVQVGGMTAASGNIIAHNANAPVRVDTTTENVHILSNSIHSNTFGIVLGVNSPNDIGDGDTGANGQLNRPVLSNLINNGGTFDFFVSIDVPASEYRLELFDNQPGEDQGRTLIDSLTLTSAGTSALFARTVTGDVTGVLTATLTPCDATCTTFTTGTSPFSAAIAPSTPTVLVNSTGDAPDTNIGDGLCDTGSTNSAGATECTLRAALAELSSASVIATVHFDIPNTEPGHNGGTWTLQPATDLPAALGDDLTIDARTQPGYVDTPVIEIDGSAVAGSGLVFSGLRVAARGFMVHSFGGTGIEMTGLPLPTVDGAVTDNWIGVDRNLNPAPNGGTGIQVIAAAAISVERNVVNGTGDGIEVFSPGAADNQILNNYIGELPDGTALSSSQTGIRIHASASQTIIGQIGAGNVISSNSGVGIRIGSGASAGTQIVGNVIEDNGIDGIAVTGSSAVVIEGNTIQRNIGDGVRLDGTSSTSVGGTSAVDRNIISGNSQDGILVSGNTSDLTIVGNTIGISNLGFPLPNQNGVSVTGSATDVAIGGTAAGSGNVIAFNTVSGVRVDQVTQDVFIIENETYSNGQGILLFPETPNDPGDADGGANFQMNRPVLSQVTNNATSFGLMVEIDAAVGEYRLELFDNNVGESEGRTHLGTAPIDHLTPGSVSYSVGVAGQVTGVLTATLTPCTAGCAAPQLGTSPFSAPVALSTPTVIVNSTSNSVDVNIGDDLCDTGLLNSEGDPQCTLDAAIAEANASPLVDAISFDIPTSDLGHSSGVWTISPAGYLGQLTDTVVLDARTQPGYVASPVIVVDGIASGVDDGLRIETTAPNSAIYGFSVVNYSDAGIWSRGNDSIMAFNYAGILPDGLTPAPNGRGIDVWDGVQRVAITSNLVSGNTASGIGVFDPGTADITIDGNYVGTDASGSIAVPNLSHGLHIDGGLDVMVGIVQGNVISGNGSNGVLNNSSNGTHFENNLIGVNASGDATIGNGGSGIYIDGTSASVRVGWTGSPNLIGGNIENGIDVASAGGTTIIQFNDIGTDAARTLDLGNGQNGLLVQTGAQNVATSYNSIGNNGLDGIRTDATITGGVTSILNEMFNNGGIGIDLGGDGPTVNDVGDGDTGPNGLLNYPVIQTLSAVGADYTIDYQLDAPAGNYNVLFYTNPSGPDPSGYGEGEIALHTEFLSHPGGLVSHSTSPVTVSGGSIISSTLRSGTATSEFGPVFRFTGISTVNSTSDLPDSNVGDGICSTGQVISTSDAECTLRAAIQEANSPIGGETIDFNILAADGVYDLTGNGEFTIRPITPLPALTKDVSIDATTQPGYSGLPLIELDGSLSSCPASDCSGLRVQAGTLAVSAMAINNWGLDGIQVDTGAEATVVNTYVGTDVVGAGAKPNAGAGIRIESGTIGGGDLAGNIIAFNGGPGVAVLGAGGTDVAVTHNSIHSNVGLGIDLGDDGVTANDLGDGDSGPNNYLNTPVVTAAVHSGGSIQIDTLVDVPPGNFMLQAFKNPIGGNANGDVQGQVLEVSIPIVSSGAGPEVESISIPGSVGDRITLTLTEDVAAVLGATSEFSRAVTAIPSKQTDVADSSENRNDGQFEFSQPVSATGIIGDAMRFDDSTDSIRLPSLNSTTGALTLSAWVNPSSIADIAIISSDRTAGDVLSLGIESAGPDGTGTVTLVLDGVPVTVAGGTIVPGNWYHLAATWDSANLDLFLDGVLVGSTPAVGSLANDSNTATHIGAKTAVSGAFPGVIDEVRVMSIAVSADWILADYSFGSQSGATGTFGAQETGGSSPWTQVGTGGRSGSGAASAPTNSAGQSWLVADSIDEGGIEFESWWYLTTDTGIDVGQGTRTAALGGAQNEVRVSSASGFDISEFGPGGSNQLQAPTGPAFGTGWRRVRVRIDQDGAAIVAVDGVDLSGPVLFDADPATGSIGFRSVALPNGEQWLVDDVLARRYVNPEPTSTVFNYERR